MMHKSHLPAAERTGAHRLVALASFCAIVLAAGIALPVALDEHGLTVKVALAGKGNGGGNGNSADAGRDNAPGQEKQLAGDDAAAADEDTATFAAETAGGEIEPPEILPIADDSEPAANKVIKELAGLPEESALSEEEELEAIRSGWGTWRTADGPETVIAQ